eukprot:2429231-Rhodomonas_salina.1
MRQCTKAPRHSTRCSRPSMASGSPSVSRRRTIFYCHSQIVIGHCQHSPRRGAHESGRKPRESTEVAPCLLPRAVAHTAVKTWGPGKVGKWGLSADPLGRLLAHIIKYYRHLWTTGAGLTQSKCWGAILLNQEDKRGEVSAVRPRQGSTARARGLPRPCRGWGVKGREREG